MTEYTYMKKLFNTEKEMLIEAVDWPQREFEEEFFKYLFEDLIIKMRETANHYSGFTNLICLRQLQAVLHRMEHTIKENVSAAEDRLKDPPKTVDPHGGDLVDYQNMRPKKEKTG